MDDLESWFKAITGIAAALLVFSTFFGGPLVALQVIQILRANKSYQGR